jgi:hypothetical protein
MLKSMVRRRRSGQMGDLASSWPNGQPAKQARRGGKPLSGGIASAGARRRPKSAIAA